MDEPVYHFLELMDTYNVRHLLAFDDTVLKGVITLHDLLKVALKEHVEAQLQKVQTKYDIATINQAMNHKI
jgi:predicted transcriptional regulator